MTIKFPEDQRSDSPMVVPGFNLNGPGRMDSVLKMRKQKAGGGCKKGVTSQSHDGSLL